MTVYETITAKENITKAYFEVIEGFDKKLKSQRYSGFDGIKINDLNLSSVEIIKKIREELIDFTELDPALKLDIPKKNKSEFRTIYIHTVKERIKSQAIYRVIEPIFNKYFSDFLFSYRKTHPHYKAIKSVAKRYRKNWKIDDVLIGDISNYSDNINKIILRKKIEKLDLDKKTLKVLDLYLNNSYLEKGLKKYPAKGIITGLPITILFNNLYLDDLDKFIGKIPSLYRRVGDDFILMDKSHEKINKTNNEICRILRENDIDSSQQKISIQKTDKIFKFLGYNFDQGKISISQSSLAKIKTRWKSKLKYYPVSLRTKKSRLTKILFGEDSLHHDFIEIINQYNQANDREQIKNLADYFYAKLTTYFYDKNTPRNRRLCTSLLKNVKLPNIIEYYDKIHSGKCDLAELRKIKYD